MLKHFKLEEFQCPCCKRAEMNPNFLETMDALREEFSLPMIINSGFRCEKHNKSVGGSPHSKHLVGLACDVSTVGFGSENLFKLINLSFDFGLSGIGIYETFVHLDARNNKVSFWRK